MEGKLEFLDRFGPKEAAEIIGYAQMNPLSREGKLLTAAVSQTKSGYVPGTPDEVAVMKADKNFQDLVHFLSLPGMLDKYLGEPEKNQDVNDYLDQKPIGGGLGQDEISGKSQVD